MNTAARSVRFRPLTDRRVRRTHLALIQALISLVQEKGYDAITVQDLLEAADIGRSTFYAHYRGKDDFLLRSFEHMLMQLDASMPPSARIAPVRELFQHVGEVHRFHRALARSAILARTYQAGMDVISASMARRLARYEGAPVQAVAQAFAGALFALLRWWVDQAMPYPPERMDELFHGLVRASAVSA